MDRRGAIKKVIDCIELSESSSGPESFAAESAAEKVRDRWSLSDTELHIARKSSPSKVKLSLDYGVREMFVTSFVSGVTNVFGIFGSEFVVYFGSVRLLNYSSLLHGSLSYRLEKVSEDAWQNEQKNRIKGPGSNAMQNMRIMKSAMGGNTVQSYDKKMYKNSVWGGMVQGLLDNVERKGMSGGRGFETNLPVFIPGPVPKDIQKRYEEMVERREQQQNEEQETPPEQVDVYPEVLKKWANKSKERSMNTMGGFLA